MISWYSDSSCSSPPSRHLEEPLRLAYSLGQRVHLVQGVVQVERGPGAGLDAERPVQWPGAVMPGPDGDAMLVEDLADVVWVHAVDLEGDRGPPVGRRRRSEDPHAIDRRQLGQGVAEQPLLVRVHGVEPGLAEIVDGRRQARRLRDRHGARLEL